LDDDPSYSFFSGSNFLKVDGTMRCMHMHDSSGSKVSWNLREDQNGAGYLFWTTTPRTLFFSGSNVLKIADTLRWVHMYDSRRLEIVSAWLTAIRVLIAFLNFESTDGQHNARNVH
jgi:hypothetical protein